MNLESVYHVSSKFLTYLNFVVAEALVVRVEVGAATGDLARPNEAYESVDGLGAPLEEVLDGIHILPHCPREAHNTPPLDDSLVEERRWSEEAGRLPRLSDAACAGDVKGL